MAYQPETIDVMVRLQVEAEQAEAFARSTADSVATFYKRLIERKLPKSTAENLTHNFLDRILPRPCGCQYAGADDD